MQDKKKNSCGDLDYKLDINSGKFTLEFCNLEDSTVVLPKGFYITKLYLLDSSAKPIYDWYFNIIRVNNNQTLGIEGYIRGEVSANIEVIKNKCKTCIETHSQGFNNCDLNFDGEVNVTILIS